MDKILEKPAIIVVVLAVLCAYLFFFRLGGMALTDPDEAFYAETAKEMLARNEWATPYLYGEPQFEKPILIYWLVELSCKVFGVNEFAARLPSAVFALIGVIAIYLLGALLFSKRAGVLAALMLASNVEYVILSRACVTDMVLAVLMLLGIMFFFYGFLLERRYCYLLSSAAFACATLTKGPIAIMLPGAALVLFFIFAKDFKAVKKMPIAFVVLVFIAVAAPWYLLAYKYHGNAFTDAFFGFQNITRFTQSEHKIGSQFYYNIPIVFGGFFPWSVFLPYGFWHMYKKLRTTHNAQRTTKSSIFILVWFLVIFIFFSISSTKLPTYIFPSFISLALITAVLWDDFLKKDAAGNLKKALRTSYYVLVAAVLIGAIAASIFIKFDYPVILAGVIISSIFLIFGFVLGLAAFIFKRFVASLFLIVYSLVIFLYPLNTLVIPELERYETSKVIAEKLKTLMEPEDRIGSESHYRAGLAFYTGKFPADLDKHHILVDFVGSGERVWGVLKEKNHRELYDLDTKPYCTKPSYMIYKLGKRAIITNKVPDDGIYLIKRERVD